MNNLRLFKGLGAMLFALVVFAVPAKAVSILPGSTNDILSAPEFTYEQDVPGAAIIDLDFNFFTSGPTPQPALAIELNIVSASNLIDGILSWRDSVTDVVLATTGLTEVFVLGTSIGFGASLSTLFTAINPTQTLRVFLELAGPAQVSLKVSAVPIPPALLLFGTSILGLGLLSNRRRRKNKNGSKAVTA